MSSRPFHWALLFGDPDGLPVSRKATPRERVCGLVSAGIRPRQHAELRLLAEAHGLPLLIQPKASSPDYQDFVQGVRSLKPDLIIANSYSMLLRPEILAIAPHGVVNIHGGLLPDYRGSNPIQWALLNQETETGVTMHYMTAEFDAGDIIAQRHVPIYFEDTWRDILARIASAIEAILAEELPRLLDGTSTRQPQDKLSARQYPRRHPKDRRIDWRQSVVHIYNLVRALVTPHPVAFYGNGADKVVLDQYLTIPQVTSLKYGIAGRANA